MLDMHSYISFQILRTPIVPVGLAKSSGPVQSCWLACGSAIIYYVINISIKYEFRVQLSNEKERLQTVQLIYGTYVGARFCSRRNLFKISFHNKILASR
jgi:hypothetical protein